MKRYEVILGDNSKVEVNANGYNIFASGLLSFYRHEKCSPDNDWIFCVRESIDLAAFMDWKYVRCISDDVTR